MLTTYHQTLVSAGVCFYQRESLPGYSAIFRHPNDELNFCYYLIPAGKNGMCGDVKVMHAASVLALAGIIHAEDEVVDAARMYNLLSALCNR